MATVNKVSKAQFTALYNNVDLSAEQIAEQLGIPKAELARLAKSCGMPLNKRAKGKRVIYLFDEEETTANNIVETVVTPEVSVQPVDIYEQSQVVTNAFQTIED